MEQFMAILSKPDNIPIAIMVPLVGFCIYWALSQGFRHDRRIKEGQKDAVYDEMIR